MEVSRALVHAGASERDPAYQRIEDVARVPAVAVVEPPVQQTARVVLLVDVTILVYLAAVVSEVYAVAEPCAATGASEALVHAVAQNAEHPIRLHAVEQPHLVAGLVELQRQFPRAPVQLGADLLVHEGLLDPGLHRHHASLFRLVALPEPSVLHAKRFLQHQIVVRTIVALLRQLIPPLPPDISAFQASPQHREYSLVRDVHQRERRCRPPLRFSTPVLWEERLFPPFLAIG
mmetsp:Transcript_33629/g.76875  ORF Transcript_33629/g.76875 Transcript_33629/m.76875 type:complete len:233 (-) Transcript_33629:248-946(-)